MRWLCNEEATSAPRAAKASAHSKSKPSMSEFESTWLSPDARARSSSPDPILKLVAAKGADDRRLA
jgi:hypothetical protein